MNAIQIKSQIDEKVKQILPVILILLLLSACDRYESQIAEMIKSDAASSGHKVLSYKVLAQRDSVDKLYVVDYQAILETKETVIKHLVLYKQEDGKLSR